MNATAVAAALVATVLTVLTHAPHPALAVVSVAAACALLAMLTQHGRVAPSDQFTVRILLAGNLIVFGVTCTDQPGAVLAVPLILNGALLAGITIRARMRQRDK